MTRGALIAILMLTGCAVPAKSPAPPVDLKSPFTGYASERYSQSRWWLCMAGREDACSGNLDATEIRPDGTHVEVRDRHAPGSDLVDCFYVYPTVDLRPWPASHENFSDLSSMKLPTLNQAARFRSVCRVFVPLYRQTSIGTYFQPKGVRAPYREVAESDVDDAFLHYMGQYNRGHKIVLMGHSQGGEMVVHLLKRFFDGDAAMRDRLLLAMPIGWPIEVAPGQTTGGTFTNLPVCTKSGETGCVVAYRTYSASHEVVPGRAAPTEGHESVCVHPGQLAHGAEVFSRSFFGVPEWFGIPNWMFALKGTGTVLTPFVMLRGYYTGRCVKGDGGFRYLEVSVAPVPGDKRESPIDLGSMWFRGELGTHLFDMQFGGGDLMDLVAQRAAGLVVTEPRVEQGR